MARRDPVGIRLITRRGNDWSARYPLVVEAVNHLKVRSCLIDGEVGCCDQRGLALARAWCPHGGLVGLEL
jgi:ATP-dependent DNA ligase